MACLDLDRIPQLIIHRYFVRRLCAIPHDSGEKVDIVDWNLSCDWPNEDPEYLQMEKDLNTLLDNILKSKYLEP